MPKVNKTLHGDVELIAKKIAHGIGSFGNMIGKRDEWTSEDSGHRVIVQVYEKQNLKPEGPHYTLTVALFDTGEEIRLFATTSGGWMQYFNNPYPNVEGELTSVLGTVLNVLDDIIM